MFQLTRPRGTRPNRAGHEIDGLSFQLTRPRGTRRAGQAIATPDSIVSTHASAGDATSNGAPPYEAGQFQLTRPRGTRPEAKRQAAGGDTFQLTRPRGTRLPAAASTLRLIVSTHASAGDATYYYVVSKESNFVSTHASAGDATYVYCDGCGASSSFNSRVRGGRDS